MGSFVTSSSSAGLIQNFQSPGWGPLNVATYKICKLWASWFQRRRFFKFFSHYKSMGANDPHGAWPV